MASTINAAAASQDNGNAVATQNEMIGNALSLSELSLTVFEENFWALESVQENGVWAEYLPLVIFYFQNLWNLSSSQRGYHDQAATRSITTKLLEARELLLELQLELVGISPKGSAAAAA